MPLNCFFLRCHLSWLIVFLTLCFQRNWTILLYYYTALLFTYIEFVWRFFRHTPQVQSHFKLYNLHINEYRGGKISEEAICFIRYICKKGRILPPSLMSSGRVVSKKVAKMMKIDSAMENEKLLQKLVKSILSISREIH